MMKLRRQILIPYFVGIVCASLFISFYWLPNVKESNVEEYIEYQRLKLKALDYSVSEFVLTSNLAALSVLFDSQRIRSWRNLTFYNNNGKKLYPIFDDGLPLDIKGDKNSYILRHKVFNQEDEIGTIFVEVNLTEKIKLIDNHVIELAVIMLSITLIIIVGTYLLLRRYMIGPLDSLTEAMSGVAKGDYSKAIKIDVNNEIGELAANFENMRNAIDAATTNLSKSREEALNAKNKAIEANSMKSKFLASVSHELRTPLNGVIGYSELLAEESLTKVQQDQIAIIKRSGEHLLSVVNQLLDLSKIESGTMHVDNIDFELRQLVDEVIETFIPLADDKGIKLVSNVNVGQFLNLKGDRLKLKQILINLVGNAVKFTNAGSVELNVLVQLLRNDDYKISFMVLDTGLGLDESEIECVFEEFVQTSDLKGVGTGLGLSISSKLVSLMGGKISVESEKGEGSEFEFTLGFVGAANKAETSEPEEVLDHSYLSGTAILYVEDNKINQSLVKGFMQKLGLDVVIASSGTRGIELAKKSSFDMILMDLRMPDLDGFETTKIIRTFNSRVPIIALSANSFESDIKLAYECGMDDFMQKPVNKKKLVKLLTKHLNEKQKSA